MRKIIILAGAALLAALIIKSITSPREFNNKMFTEHFDHAEPPTYTLGFNEAFDHAEPSTYTLGFNEAFDHA